MIRLSIQARQALARLTLPVLIVASFALMLLGKADALLAERARMRSGGRAGADLRVAGGPARDESTAPSPRSSRTMGHARGECPPARGKRAAAALAIHRPGAGCRNQRLKASLRWIPDPDASFLTARVVADAGGVYAKAVLLSIGPNHSIRKGEIAVDERGLVGRITEVGARTARVLLITDLNSRIPVILETSRAHAILVGTNGRPAAAAVLAGGRRTAEKASGSSPAPRPMHSRPICRSAPCTTRPAARPKSSPPRCCKNWRSCGSSTMA